MIADIAIGSPLAHVAALLATCFARPTAGERDAVRALRRASVATVERATLRASDRAACLAAAEWAQGAALRVEGDARRVAVMAVVVRELLVDAPESYCALDRHIRDACERLYPATEGDVAVALAVVAGIVEHLRTARAA